MKSPLTKSALSWKIPYKFAPTKLITHFQIRGHPTAATSAVIATTNRAMRRNFNEAELVRRHREGLDMQGLTARMEDNPVTLGDPALGRAIDFLKGLAVVQQFGKSLKQ